MKYSALDVIAVAKKWIGYTEKGDDSNLNSFAGNGTGNHTIFAYTIDNKFPTFYNGRKNSFDWCDVFYDFCHLAASGGGDVNNANIEDARYTLCQPLKSAGAGCTYSAQYYKNAGRYGLTPAIGAQVFFGDYDHTGLVYAYDDTMVYTIEGNTSGGKVAYKSYYRRDDWVLGYGYPRYGSSGETTIPSTPAQQTTPKPNVTVFSPWKKYKNGSTPEVVYKGSDGSTLYEQVGSLNPGEVCYCDGKYGNTYHIFYLHDGTSTRFDTGYVKYSGGVD